MSNESNLDVIETKTGNVLPGFGSLKSFELVQRIAGLFSKSTLVPQQYQGNMANCVVALNMANRMNADVLMTMQNLYIVHGNPAWSSKFLIATFNTCGRFTALRYRFTGTQGQDNYGCIAWAVEKETGEKLEGSEITIAIAKKEGWYNKNGSKWQTMPQQMLMYRAASWFIRAYAPEISMGLYTEDEVIDVTPEPINAARQEIRTNANTEVFALDHHTEPPKKNENPSNKNAKPEKENEIPQKNTAQTEQQAPQEMLEF